MEEIPFRYKTSMDGDTMHISVFTKDRWWSFKVMDNSLWTFSLDKDGWVRRHTFSRPTVSPACSSYLASPSTRERA